MDGKDGAEDPIQSFTVKSLRLEEETWREFASQEATKGVVNSFCTADYCNLFIHRHRDYGLSVSLDFPRNITSKVICVSKTTSAAATRENDRKILMIQEVRGSDVLSVFISVTEQVTFPLLSNPKSSSRWAVGVADEVLRFMERQKNEALVMKAQTEGYTFLPFPDALHDDGLNNDVPHDDGLHDDDLQDDALNDDPDDGGFCDDAPHDDGLHDSSLQDDGLHDSALHDRNPHDDKAEGGKLSDMKLLHACDWTIIEWAELVSEFLQQDSSQLVLDGLKPLPSAEFQFWKARLKNLLFIQQQLMSSSAQQVASVVQKADSIYWFTLRNIYRDVQEGLREAKDVTLNLDPLQEKLLEVEKMEYQQLNDLMTSVMEEVRQVWINSEFYCKPCRMVVLLQEICNLFIHLSRKFLRKEEVMHHVVSEPGPVLADVRLVIQTLQTFREAYSHVRTQLEDQKQSWDFSSHLIFFHLDNFLKRLHSIQEVLCVSLQLEQLDQTVLSGVGGQTWTNVVQDVYQDFLRQVTILSECDCDPTDPNDQSFEVHLDQFRVQVSDLDRRLLSVFSKAFEDCSVSSAAKIMKMFGFVLSRPLLQDQLLSHLVQLEKMVLMELDQIELLYYIQRERSETFTRFTPTTAAGLCWAQQLRLRAEETLGNYKTVQHLCVDSGNSQLVLQRCQQITNLLQDFRDRVGLDWSSQLDSDCGFILDQPLIQSNKQGLLGVNCSYELETVLRELRYVSRARDVELRPHAAQLFTCRGDITKSYLNLSHMVSWYNQVVSDVLQVEIPLIQDQLQELNQNLSELQKSTWGSAGVQELVEQQMSKVLTFHSTVGEARANLDAMTNIIQGWAELHLLQRSDDSMLEGRVTEQSYRCLRQEGQELLRLTQVNQSLYRAADSSESWISYLDYIDDKVQDGLFQLLVRSLNFLSDNINPQRCTAALLAVSLQLQESGSVFEPSLGRLCDLLKTIISDVYTAASLPPRISVGRQDNYQLSLQQCPELSLLEQDILRHLLQVKEEAKHFRAGLDRYAHLWQSDRQGVMQEFLTYSRQLGPEELVVDESPPNLKDFKREIESLHKLHSEVTLLDEVIILHGWLQVNLQPFRDSLLSVIHDWKNMYTDYLLGSVGHSLQMVTQRGDDEESSSASCFPLTETIILLEAAGVELPEHLSAQLQC